MTKENKEMLLSLIQQHKELGISEQIDYEKFYLYSIITHSTAIEGSTVTELEAQLLFDEGITSQKRTLVEQLMNLDLKTAYDYGMKWIKHHEAITVSWLITLASKVMARTGSEYHSLWGRFLCSQRRIKKTECDSRLWREVVLHCKHLKWDIDQFVKSMAEKMVDKIDFAEEMVDKASIS